jgi:CheY-like chemotaxis protein
LYYDGLISARLSLGILQILIAEDDIDAVELYRAILESRGHIVTITLDGRECVDAYAKAIQRLVPAKGAPRSGPYDAVILDYKMPLADGLEVAKEIVRLNPHQRIIFASAYVKETLMDLVRELSQVTELIQKPFEPDLFVDFIEDTSTVSRLGDLNLMVKEMTDRDASSPNSRQIAALMQLLKDIQKAGTIS